MRKYLRAAAVMVGVMASEGAWADEEDDGGEGGGQLPSLVAERVRAEFPTAKLASAARRGAWWEASVVTGLQRHDLLLDAMGNVAEHRETLAARHLPPEIRDSLDRSHPRHTIWRATRITTGGETFHEVLLARGERRVTMVFDPYGRALAGAKG